MRRVLDIRMFFGVNGRLDILVQKCKKNRRLGISRLSFYELVTGISR